MDEALSLARELSHPFSLLHALYFTAQLYQHRREGRLAQEWAEATLTLATEQEDAFFLAHGTIVRGWALAEQVQPEEGIAQLRQGMAAYRATGAEMHRPYWLTLLAEAYGKGGQAEEGLSALAEALPLLDILGPRFYEVELHRLKGELLLALSAENQAEAEASFRQALEVARRQSAKSLELRAAVSLSLLWQRQGKKEEARQMLAEIYGWFT
jgi:predicted ATPase